MRYFVSCANFSALSIVLELTVFADNRVFIILYKELWYRHVYARMQRGPSIGHRYDSYQNYQVSMFVPPCFQQGSESTGSTRY